MTRVGGHVNYWVLATDSDEGGVIDAVPNPPANWKYYAGVSLKKEFPKKAALRFTPNFPKLRKLEDFQANIVDTHILSPRAREVLAPFLPKGTELLPVAIQDQKRKVIATDYAILNVLKVVKAVDEKKSVFRVSAIDPDEICEVRKLVLDKMKLPKGLKVFRLGRITRATLVDDDGREAIQEAKLTGCRFFPANGWDSLLQD